MGDKVNGRRDTMDEKQNYGFIHQKLDIKILILYILEQLPGPVDALLLSDLTLFDGGFNWFDYTDCLAELVTTEHLREEGGRYEITEKGRRNLAFAATSLPYSVRAKADRLVAPVAAVMRRQRQIETVTDTAADGSVSVSLRLSDGVGEVLALRLGVPDAATGQAVEQRFRDQAEDICTAVIRILTE